jgi:hypothetical protein
MSRFAILIATMLLAMMIALPIAYAAAIQCTTLNCNGTPKKDNMLERRGDNRNDNISALAQNDRLRAGQYTDDVDRLSGQRGNDRLRAFDGDPDDSVNGGPGFDRCSGDGDPGDPGNEADQYLNCEVVNGVEQ